MDGDVQLHYIPTIGDSGGWLVDRNSEIQRYTWLRVCIYRELCDEY
jgi:hypothetical protein